MIVTDKTILDFALRTDTQNSDVIYFVRGLGADRDSYQTKEEFLREIDSDQINVDVVLEKTLDAGVDVEGVIMKDNAVHTDTIVEKTPDAGVSFPNTVKWKNFFKSAALTEGQIYDALELWIPVTSNTMSINGGGVRGAVKYIVVGIQRQNATTIKMNLLNAGGVASPISISTGSTQPWSNLQVMSNQDPF